MLLYHMGKEFLLNDMPERKIIRKFRGWGGTHEDSGSLTIHVGANLCATLFQDVLGYSVLLESRGIQLSYQSKKDELAHYY